MEFEISKLKSLQYKVALSVVIIRNKPNNLTLDQYLKLLRINFSQIHGQFSNKIQDLKLKLMEAKREIFYLKNRDHLSQNSGHTVIESRKNEIENSYESLKLTEQYKINLDFITNIAKLKAIKNFKFDQNIDNQMLKDCMSQLIDHIRIFLFEYSLKDEKSSNEESSFIVTDTIESINQTQNLQLKQKSYKLKFPFESILHGIQVFVNLFDVEWFYTVRNMLIDQIVLFIDELVKFMVKFKSTEINCQTIQLYSQILIIFSTSDCLLNQVVFAITNTLKIVIEYISDLNRFLQINENKEGDEKNSKKKELDNLCNNCTILTECLSSIVSLRQIEYYTPINEQIKENLNQILNNLFINLTETFPLIAIQLSKLIQLLALFK